MQHISKAASSVQRSASTTSAVRTLQRSVHSLSKTSSKSSASSTQIVPFHVFTPRRLLSGRMGGYSGNYNDYQTRLPANTFLVTVPQQTAWVIERFGRFNRVLSPGLNVLIPLIDKIAYVHSLKEEAIPVSNQTAITADNVTINIDGVLYLKIVDPIKASYGVANIYFAMTQLAQTTMRSELGKITLDKTFAERESLNADIVKSINHASEPWGVSCLRYEIRDISPPPGVKLAMDMQAEAERKKRATILDSEGAQQAEINVADGQRQSTILQAHGEAAAIIARAEATAKGIELLAKAIQSPGGKEAVALRIAEQYVDAFANIAKEGNTMLLPSNPGDPSTMVAQAVSIFDNIMHKTGGNPKALAAQLQATESTQSISSHPNSSS